jgi:2-methylcitrate dehydratase PrpD
MADGLPGLTRSLGAFAARTTSHDLPDELRRLVPLYVLDALGTGLVGRDLPWTRHVQTVATRAGGRPESRMLGSDQRMPAAAAAWVNGVAVGGHELDHGGHLAHPASTVLPAALAVAEAQNAGGERLMTAIAVGYEVAARVGRAHTRAAEDVRGFHNPGVNGPLGAAAAAASLLGLDPARAVSALGIAASSSGGLTEYLADGSMTKRLHLGAAARAGVEAAELAALGVTGPSTAIEGARGLLHAFGDGAAPPPVGDLGRHWLAASMRIKPWPCHGTLQALVGVLQDLRASSPGIRPIRVELALPVGDRLHEERFHQTRPATLIQAQMSLPFCASVAASHDLSRPLTMCEALLSDAEVLALASRVSISTGPGLTRPVLTLHRAETDPISATVDPLIGRPVSGAAVRAKFRTHTADLLEPGPQEHLITLCERLDTLADVREITATAARASRLRTRIDTSAERN